MNEVLAAVRANVQDANLGAEGDDLILTGTRVTNMNRLSLVSIAWFGTFVLLSSAGSPALAEGPGGVAASLPKLETVDSVLLFLAFFIPGFIIVQVYSMLVPGEPSDFSKRVNEVLGYSAMHYAVTGWLLVVSNFSLPVGYLVIFVIPAAWPFLVLWIRRSGLMRTLPQPDPTPWDFFFSKQTHRTPANRGLYVRVRTKTGETVGGYYGDKSASSTYPKPRQLYLEKAYKVASDGTATTMTKTAGVIINCDEAEYILFREE